MNGHISLADNTIGSKIRHMRLRNSWNQEMVAERLGISVPAFSKIETGLTNINITRLKELAEIFDTTVQKLLHATADSTDWTDSAQLEELKELYQQKNEEFMQLQSKAIELYEELRKKNRLRKK